MQIYGLWMNASRLLINEGKKVLWVLIYIENFPFTPILHGMEWRMEIGGERKGKKLFFWHEIWKSNFSLYTCYIPSPSIHTSELQAVVRMQISTYTQIDRYMHIIHTYPSVHANFWNTFNSSHSKTILIKNYSLKVVKGDSLSLSLSNIQIESMGWSRRRIQRRDM